ncbi:flagellar biosynthetic protein FliP [Gammaproteobacteria bacterium 42_54_T18]|nr:flagellar biosynthetic protein FliP [Gammaproteobacteria bacterium 42_54_T18]
MLVSLAFMLVSSNTFADAAGDIFTLSMPSMDGEPETVSNSLKILALLTVLSLAPAIVIITTSFTRIIIVLSMLRHAFGMPSTPPNTVIIGLALLLTLFTMTPVIDQIQEKSLQPYIDKQIDDTTALNNASAPVREFMISQTRDKDIALVLELANEEVPDSADDISMTQLVTAFLLSELQTAFQIGFVIFLPFLAIDLIVASILMSMGMMMVPPMTISLPIKILMFVLIEGWALVAQALVSSF